MDLGLFKEFTDYPLGPNGYDLSVIVPWRLARFQHSVATNGHFWAGPFTHLAVQFAAHLFTYRFFGNCSAEYPEGYLDINTLMAFEGVTRNANGDFEWKAGREHIPGNWYRRAIGDDYGIPALDTDAVKILVQHPELATVGGNTGQPNTFTGLNVGNITGGVFSAETLLQGNNAMCFAFQAVSSVAPDILRGLVGNVLLAVQKLTDVLTPIVDELGCPQLAKFDTSSFSQFPGAQDGI